MREKKQPTILLATGIYPPDVGGPAYYAQSLNEEFKQNGFKTIVRAYRFEKKLPIGLRHLYYFLRLCLIVPRVDYIIALDTFSAGLPASWAARIFGKKIVVRTGGDFLWEAYVDRTKEPIPLSIFYNEPRTLNLKERVIFKLTSQFLATVDLIIFSTDWQKGIWLKAYNLDPAKTVIVENHFAPLIAPSDKQFVEKKYLWAGRDIFIKNLGSLEKAFSLARADNPEIELEIFKNLPQTILFEKIKESYALIVPSISEISPNLILEGLALGKPFILSRETGLAKRFLDCGLLIDPLDVEDLKRAMLKLAEPDIYRSCQQTITNLNFKHSYRDICLEFINLLTKL